MSALPSKLGLDTTLKLALTQLEPDITDLQKKVEKIEPDITDLQKKVYDILKLDIHNMWDSVNKILESSITKPENESDANFLRDFEELKKSVNEFPEKLRSKISTLEVNNKIRGIESRIDPIETKYNELKDIIDNLTNRLSKLEEQSSS